VLYCKVPFCMTWQLVGSDSPLQRYLREHSYSLTHIVHAQYNKNPLLYCACMFWYVPAVLQFSQNYNTSDIANFYRITRQELYKEYQSSSSVAACKYNTTHVSDMAWVVGQWLLSTNITLSPPTANCLAIDKHIFAYTAHKRTFANRQHC